MSDIHFFLNNAKQSIGRGKAVIEKSVSLYSSLYDHMANNMHSSSEFDGLLVNNEDQAENSIDILDQDQIQWRENNENTLPNVDLWD